MKSTEKTLRLFVIIGIGTLFSQFVAFWEKFLLSRYLGPSNFGLFSLAISMVNLILFFIYFGIPTGIVRFSSVYLSKREYEKWNGLIVFAIRFSLIGGLIFALLTFGFADRIADFYKKDEMGILIKIIAPSILFLLFSDYVSAMYMGMSDPTFKAGFRGIFFNTFRIILYALGVIFSYSLLQFSMLYTLSTLGLFTIALFKLPKTRPEYGFEFEVKKLLGFSFPIALMSVFTLFMGKIDNIILGHLINVKTVGFYSIAFFMARMLRFPLNIASESYFPMASYHYGKGEMDALNNLYKSISAWVFFLTAPIFIGALFFAKPIIRIIFGGSYLPSVRSFEILLFGHFFLICFGLFGVTISSVGRTRALFYTSITSTILNILLDILLIPVWGMNGAAIGSAGSIVFYAFINFLFLRKKFNLSPFKKESGFSIIVVIVAALIGKVFLGGRFSYYFGGLFELVFIAILIKKLKSKKEEFFTAFPIMKKLFHYKDSQHH